MPIFMCAWDVVWTIPHPESSSPRTAAPNRLFRMVFPSRPARFAALGHETRRVELEEPLLRDDPVSRPSSGRHGRVSGWRLRPLDVMMTSLLLTLTSP